MEGLAKFLLDHREPQDEKELMEHFGWSEQELQAACATEENKNFVCHRELCAGVVVYWHKDLLHGGGDSYAKSGALTSKRGAKEQLQSQLAELKRKKIMIEKHAGAGAKETKELTEVTEKWRDAALQILTDLKEKSGSEKSLSALCKGLNVDPKVVGVEQEEEEEE